MSREAHTALMLKQANKSRSAKPYRVACVMQITDMEKHLKACAHGRQSPVGDEFIYTSQAIKLRHSKTISDTLGWMREAVSSWWGYTTIGMIVVDIETQEILSEHWI